MGNFAITGIGSVLGLFIMFIFSIIIQFDTPSGDVTTLLPSEETFASQASTLDYFGMLPSMFFVFVLLEAMGLVTGTVLGLLSGILLEVVSNY